MGGKQREDDSAKKRHDGDTEGLATKGRECREKWCHRESGLGAPSDGESMF